MNPLPGAIFLDKDFTLPSGVVKPMYLMVVCDLPGTSQSVLFSLIDPFADEQDEEGPDWEWPERFVLQHQNSPLNRPTAVLLDDVYRANSAILTQRCSHIGSFHPLITADILAALSESRGVSGRYAEVIREMVYQINPQL